MASYRKISRREVYANAWVALEVHEIVHPTGIAGEHVLVVTPPACAVVVRDGDDVIFARQPRFGADREMIELVKGGAEEGESSLACAQRELREELGFLATSWEPLGILYEIPSIVKLPVSVFVASDVRAVATAQEAVERIELVRMTLIEAIDAAVSGEFTDAITVAALLRYALRITAAAR